MTNVLGVSCFGFRVWFCDEVFFVRVASVDFFDRMYRGGSMIVRKPVFARWFLALLAIVGFSSAVRLHAAEPVVGVQGMLMPRDKGKFHLYLLIGQSNMAGRGVVEEADKKPHPQVNMFNKENTWVQAVDPLHFDKPIAGVGLGSSFGRAMADADPEIVIGLIPCAVGGTPLARWQKGKDLYEQALVRAKLAMKEGTLKGILWHQGEGDSKREEDAKSYGERLAKMVTDLRDDLGAGDVPFVAGRLGEFLKAKEGKPVYFDVVNQGIDSIATRVAKAASVSSEGLKHKGDGVHFDSASLREFGKRYAAAMQKLQAEKR
jgi:hypothetical protein